jgi:hypothetical protein
MAIIKQKKKLKNSVALSPRANYTDWTTAICRRNLVPTFVDRGVSRGQHGGSPTVVNLSSLDRSRYFSFRYSEKSGNAGNRTKDLWVSSQELWPAVVRRFLSSLLLLLLICPCVCLCRWLLVPGPLVYTIKHLQKHTRADNQKTYI